MYLYIIAGPPPAAFAMLENPMIIPDCPGRRTFLRIFMGFFTTSEYAQRRKGTSCMKHGLLFALISGEIF